MIISQIAEPVITTNFRIILREADRSMQNQTTQALQVDSCEPVLFELNPNQWNLERLNQNELEVRRALQICSNLLEYPDSDFLFVQESIEELNNSRVKGALTRFWESYQEKNFIERAEQYVATFDFCSSTSLYLTAYEESQEEQNRGMALLHMKEVYTENGLQFQAHELPDYLPTFLEFLSVAPLSQIQMALKLYTPSIERLASELRKVKSPYDVVIDICLIQFRALLELKEDST